MSSASNKEVYLIFHPVDFAVEFVQRMRKRIHELSYYPSLRQAIAIARLLTARLFRKRKIMPFDYIDVAVKTTAYEDQKIAMEEARKIIFGEEEKIEKPKLEDHKIISKTLMKRLSKRALKEIFEIIEEIELLKNLRAKPSKKLLSVLHFYELVSVKASQGESPYKELVELIDYDLDKIKLYAIDNLNQFIDFVQKYISLKLGYLSPEDAKNILNLGWVYLLKQSSAIWEKLLVEENKTKLEDTINKLIMTDILTAARTILYLLEVGKISQEEYEVLEKKIFNKIVDIQMLYNVSICLGKLPPINFEEIIIRSLRRYTPRRVFEYVKAIDSKFGTNFRFLAFDIISGNVQLSIEDLLYMSIFTEKWRESVIAKLEEFFKKRESVDQLLEGYQTIKKLLVKLTLPHASYFIEDYLLNIKYEILKKASSPKELIDLLKMFLKDYVKPDIEVVMKIAKEKGISEEKIAFLYGDHLKVLEILYKTGEGTYDQIMDLLIKVKLKESMLERLLNYVMNHWSKEHLAALAHYDLPTLINIASRYEKTVPDIMSRIFGSLTAGPGENLLLTYYLSRDRLPEKYRGILKELAKKVLIDLAITYSSKLFGGIDPGVVQISRARKFLFDHDIEFINMEETIENLILEAKNPMRIPISYDDLYVNETRKGRVATVVLLDISGSMAELKLVWCAIATALLCLKLKEEDFAISIFESNTHKIKDIDENVDLELVADNLLMLEAKGGTMISRAIEWAMQQFSKSSSEHKILVIASDFAFFDRENAFKLLGMMFSKFSPFTIMIAPKFSYSRSTISKLQKIIHGELVEIRDIKLLPRMLTEIIKKFHG